MWRSFMHQLVSALVRVTPAFGGTRKVPKDLSGKDLRGKDLRGRDLDRARLADAHLEKADLTGAGLENADLTGAFLDGARFQEARLSQAKFARSQWSDTTAWPPSVGQAIRDSSEQVAPGRYRVTEDFRVPSA